MDFSHIDILVGEQQGEGHGRQEMAQADYNVSLLKKMTLSYLDPG